MLIVVYDPVEKNIIRGVFKFHKTGLNLVDPEELAEKVLAGRDTQDYVDEMEAAGFESVAWTAVELPKPRS